MLDRHDSALFSPRCSRTVPRGGRGALPRPHERAGARRGRRVRRARRARPRRPPAPRRPGRRALERPRCGGRTWRRDGSYRLKVSLSGRRIELLNPLALDTAVRLLGTQRLAPRDLAGLRCARRSRARWSCAGASSSTGVQLQVREGDAPRAHRARRPPRAGARGQLAAVRRQALHDGARRALPPAPDRARRAGQHPRARPRRGDGARRRALAARPLDRRRQARARGHLRRRAGPAPRARAARRRRAAVLARGTRAPAAVARVPAAHAGRRLRRLATGMPAAPHEALLAVRGARPARVALLVDRAPAAVARCPSSGGSTRSASASTRSRCATRAQGVLDGYAALVVPPVGGSVGRDRGRAARDERSPASSPGSARDPGRDRARRARPASPGCSRPRRARRGSRALALLAGGTLGLLAWLGVARHVARARSAGGRRARRRARARGRRPRARSGAGRSLLPFALCLALPFRFPVHIGEPGREPARPALRGDRRRVDRARARRPARRRARCGCRRGASRCRCSCSSPGRAPRLPGATARPRAPRRSRSTRCPSASCWRRSSRTRRRGRACPTCCASRSPSRSPSRRSASTSCARHDIWWNRKLMVSNAFSSFFRVNSIFYDPSIFGRYLAVTIVLVFAALLFGSVRRAARGRGGGGARLGRHPHLVLAIGASSRSARRSGRASCWPSGGGSRGCCWPGRCSSGSRCWPSRRCANSGVDRVTSERSQLVGDGLRLFREHPLAGVGLGGSTEAAREQTLARPRAAPRAARDAADGRLGARDRRPRARGLAARRSSRASRSHAGAGGRSGSRSASALLAIFVHSLFYAAFFEDPLTWALAALLVACAAPGMIEER